MYKRKINTKPSYTKCQHFYLVSYLSFQKVTTYKIDHTHRRINITVLNRQLQGGLIFTSICVDLKIRVPSRLYLHNFKSHICNRGPEQQINFVNS